MGMPEDLAQQVADLNSGLREHIEENIRAHGKLFTALGELSAAQGEMTREVARLREEETTLARVVIGEPGKPGYDERLRGVETFRSDMRKILWIIVPAIVVGALSLVWEAIQFYLHQKPV